MSLHNYRYTTFVMAFSVFVELLNLNLRLRKVSAPVELHEPYASAADKGTAAAAY